MTNHQKLYTGIGKAAWGYFFVYFDFNIGSVSIIPTFVGFLLFLSAINYLADEARELHLLKTLGAILAAWHGIAWLASWVSLDLTGILPAVDIIISVINIYFHFQFLTNLASIASKHQPKGYQLDEKLLSYCTMQTLLLTTVVFIGYLTKWLYDFVLVASVCMVVAYIIAGILLMKALFDLRRGLSMEKSIIA